MTTPPAYERAVMRARRERAPAEQKRRAVAKVQVQGAAPHRRSRWHRPSLLAGALAATCATAMTVAVLWPDAQPLTETVPAPAVALQIGNRVAILPQGGTRYALRHTDEQTTEIEVFLGHLSLRLMSAHGADPDNYNLAVRAGDLVATAEGTVFTVTKPANGEPRVTVHEGQVKVTHRNRAVTVGPGLTWPSTAAPAAVSATALEQLHAFSIQPPLPAAAAETSADAEEETPLELWRRARLLRGQGKPNQALKALERLERSNSETWTPLSLIEQMRLYDTIFADPGKVLTLGRTFFERYSEHRLSTEVKELYCSASTQTQSHDRRCE